MPSFKSCLTSLALMAITLAPMISAKGTHAKGALVARDAHPVARSVGSPAAGLEKRVSSQKRSAAKAAAKKRALARRAAKAAAAAAPVPDAYTSGPFATSATFLQATTKKCSRAQNCEDITLVPNSYAVCYNRRCGYRCSTGFNPVGTQCQPSAGSCPNEASCPSVANGSTGCDDTSGLCTLNCDTGLSLFQSSSGAYSCINTSNNLSNCGAVGKACASSYNGVGSPVCFNSVCSLRCPGGTFPRSSGSATQPQLCS